MEPIQPENGLGCAGIPKVGGTIAVFNKNKNCL